MPMKAGSPSYAVAMALVQVALLAGCKPAEVTDRGANTENAQGTEPPAQQIVVKGPERLILAFGDSLYAGYGLARGQSMPAHVEQLLRQRGLNAKIINAGVSGDTTSAGQKRLAFALDK